MKIHRIPRPNFSKQDVVHTAKDLFGISGTAIELSGERDRNFMIRDYSGEKFILKVSNPADDESVIDFHNRLLAHLSEDGSKWKWPQPKPNNKGKLISICNNRKGQKYRVRMLSFVEGIFLTDFLPHNTNLMEEIGRFIGSVSKTLKRFSHPAMHRNMFWDLKHGLELVQTYLVEIANPEKEDKVGILIELIEKTLAPIKDNLREQVIYNDANDHNLLVQCDHSGIGKIIGAIDVGDSLYSWLAAEPAVACAYAMLNKKNPLKTARNIIGAYHKIYPLSEKEISALFSLTALRVCMSVTISAYQKKMDRKNTYLSVSEDAAWKLIDQLIDIPSQFAHFSFRHACDLEPSPITPHLVQWLKKNRGQFGNLLDLDKNREKFSEIDLSVGSPILPGGSWTDTGMLSSLLSKPYLGRYNESRLIYIANQFNTSDNMDIEPNTVHLGIDIFLEAGTNIYTPLDGVIHSIQNNKLSFDQGPTVILYHTPDNAPSFYTLYRHLSINVLSNLKTGIRLAIGEKIGTIGHQKENGGCPPHLHFQVITDLLGYDGNFPGSAKPSDRDIWLSISPDPLPLMSINLEKSIFKESTEVDLFNKRKSFLSNTLSISYRKPLKIVRGWMQYLYDYEGRQYLDAVNNVPHVGHCNPKVIEAIVKQTTVLNINTRYLHDHITQLAEKLASMMPKSLSVCFFVNSGSEANDLAMRLASAHTGRDHVMTVEGGYHGNLTTLIDISPYKFNGPGGKGKPSHVTVVPMPDGLRGKHKYSDSNIGQQYADEVAKLVENLDGPNKISAFICESMISSGGLIIPPDNYLNNVYKSVRGAGGVCIADEIVVGFGRTGKYFWGFEHQSVVPDIVTLGKPMGNGHPIAAVVTTPEIAASFDQGMEYFNTYGGNPVSCAAALAVLEVITEQKLQENATKVGDYLINQLKKLQKKHPIIGDIRGSGFFIGVELVINPDNLEPAPKHAAYITERMKQKGILISTDGILGNVLKIRPPMVFDKSNANNLILTLEKTVNEAFCQQINL